MLILISIVVSVISVLIMWAYMCRVSALRNGWGQLIEKYGFQEKFSGSLCLMQSAILNGFAFTKTLDLGVDPNGFYLRGSWLLRFDHPAVLVPWSEITVKRLDRTHSSGYALLFAAFPEMSCELSDATLKKLADASRPEWGLELPWGHGVQ